uniref:Protein kinase domain-containing protein n=1 Tax=Macrostomum lignano TaxID=282301 RepID=A0A1I8FUG5_9PLAT
LRPEPSHGLPGRVGLLPARIRLVPAQQLHSNPHPADLAHHRGDQTAQPPHSQSVQLQSASSSGSNDVLLCGQVNTAAVVGQTQPTVCRERTPLSNPLMKVTRALCDALPYRSSVRDSRLLSVPGLAESRLPVVRQALPDCLPVRPAPLRHPDGYAAALRQLQQQPPAHSPISSSSVTFNPQADQDDLVPCIGPASSADHETALYRLCQAVLKLLLLARPDDQLSLDLLADFAVRAGLAKPSQARRIGDVAGVLVGFGLARLLPLDLAAAVGGSGLQLHPELEEAVRLQVAASDADTAVRLSLGTVLQLVSSVSGVAKVSASTQYSPQKEPSNPAASAAHSPPPHQQQQQHQPLSTPPSSSVVPCADLFADSTRRRDSLKPTLRTCLSDCPIDLEDLFSASPRKLLMPGTSSGAATSAAAVVSSTAASAASAAGSAGSSADWTLPWPRCWAAAQIAACSLRRPETRWTSPLSAVWRWQPGLRAAASAAASSSSSFAGAHAGGLGGVKARQASRDKRLLRQRQFRCTTQTRNWLLTTSRLLVRRELLPSSSTSGQSAAATFARCGRSCPAFPVRLNLTLPPPAPCRHAIEAENAAAAAAARESRRAAGPLRISRRSDRRQAPPRPPPADPPAPQPPPAKRIVLDSRAAVSAATFSELLAATQHEKVGPCTRGADWPERRRRRRLAGSLRPLDASPASATASSCAIVSSHDLIELSEIRDFGSAT